MKKAEKMFKDVNEANNLLSDKKKRQAYDSGMSLEDIESGAPNMGDFGDMFGGGGPGGGMRFS